MSRFLSSSLRLGAATAALATLMVAGAGIWLACVQAQAPALAPATAGVRDDVVGMLAARDEALMIVKPGRLQLPITFGAEMLELFLHVDGVETGGEDLLRHASPVIRAYAAFHVVRSHPERLKELRPLLADEAPLLVASAPGWPRKTETVASATVAMLCAAVAEAEPIKEFLAAVRRDPHLLGVRSAARACLEDDGSADVDVAARMLKSPAVAAVDVLGAAVVAVRRYWR